MTQKITRALLKRCLPVNVLTGEQLSRSGENAMLDMSVLFFRFRGTCLGWPEDPLGPPRRSPGLPNQVHRRAMLEASIMVPMVARKQSIFSENLANICQVLVVLL